MKSQTLKEISKDNKQYFHHKAEGKCYFILPDYVKQLTEKQENTILLPDSKMFKVKQMKEMLLNQILVETGSFDDKFSINNIILTTINGKEMKNTRIVGSYDDSSPNEETVLEMHVNF
jgi:hypothetical protein